MPTVLEMRESQTTAPQLLTENELIKLMDRHGIGTDATIATHISTIQSRGYAVKQGQYFTPTNLGVALLDGYAAVGFNLADPVMRAEVNGCTFPLYFVIHSLADGTTIQANL